MCTGLKVTDLLSLLAFAHNRCEDLTNITVNIGSTVYWVDLSFLCDYELLGLGMCSTVCISITTQTVEVASGEVKPKSRFFCKLNQHSKDTNWALSKQINTR